MIVNCVLPAQATLGEGPVWCPRTQALYWIDILDCKVHRYDPATGRDMSVTVPSYIGSLALTEGDRLLVALQHELCWLNLQTAEVTSCLLLEENPGNRMNDGKCDAAGRFWVGSMNLKENEPSGVLHRVSGDLRAERMLTGLTISNGIGWSPDQKRMYLADSGAGAIFVFDFNLEAGSLHNRRVFLDVPPRGGVPDGLCVDTAGCVWSAFWDGACVARFTPEGKLDRTIDMPVPRPTSVAFGGPDLTTLYVTSARCGLTQKCLSDEYPLSGNLFAIESTGAQGLPTQRFR